MDVDYRSSLDHELPDKGIVCAFVDVADVDGRLFVLLPAIMLLVVRYGRPVLQTTYQCFCPDISTRIMQDKMWNVVTLRKHFAISINGDLESCNRAWTRLYAYKAKMFFRGSVEL